nr:endoplasmic reticulum metallopeptidase 1 isoform X2 [Ipomoea trifida]
MALTLSSGDVAGFKVLFSLVILYGLISFLAYSVLHMKFITPLGMDASLDLFSEARAIEHVRVLAKDIGRRQEGTPGLRQAAEYIKSELETLKRRARSNVRVEIEETTVDGSFNMIFLGYSISFTYRNHTNIIMRISSVQSGDNDPSVLVNGHFDTTPGSPGAGDCGSCVASILELARFTIDSDWVPPKPVIFLFNGAEELFMLGSHGFITTHRWRDTIGAFINVEASGIGGSDLVCQSGPSTWPSQVYSKAALYPMANSAAQDVFGFVPGDTDYRMFAQDYGDIPGLDTIFLLGGYFYHTSSDTVERLLPGSLQARGDNLVSLIRAFTNSSELRNAHERKLHSASQHGLVDERAVFFDFFSWFLIFYTRKAAILLYSVPLAIFLFMPLLLRFRTWGLTCSFATFFDYIKGLLYHAVGLVLAIVVPIIFAVMRLLFSGNSMNWFANPFLAFGMFIPFSLIGLLIPRFAWGHFPLSQNLSLLGLSNQELVTEARFWGAFGFYSIVTLAYLAAGLNGGFLTFLILVFMIPAWISFCLCNKAFGHESLRSTASYVIPAIPCVMYAAYFGGFLAIFLIEKMSMSGSHPSSPYGYFIPDVIVAATIGVISALRLLKELFFNIQFGMQIFFFSHYHHNFNIIDVLVRDMHLKCTVWDEHVAAIHQFYNIDVKQPIIVAIQLCRAKIVNGEVRITSSYDATKLWINHSFAEFAEFRSKLAAENSPHRSITTTTVLSDSTGLGDLQSGSITITTLSDLLMKEEEDIDIPPELESLIGRSMIFKLSLKRDQMRGPTSAYNVMRVITDQALVDEYCSRLNDTQEKDLISRMIEEDDDDSFDSDEEGSKGDEVNSPVNATQEKGKETDSENSDTIKRCLLDQFSTSTKLKKSRMVTVKTEKI